ncbi:MAG: Na/Pi symporter [Rhodobacterales bacterium]|nr:Na/Pi symporter [Rhodobacterales bacterium]MDX5414572.1 Na/Pi symporter [Rhodobacterales bacterium]
MTDGLAVILGGIGMFLFGMKIMTEALREAAGGRLRQLLARFTTTPLAGVVTGTAATAVVQSSSATTVMTIGFVGAGLLTFPQAIGVIYGANIGTTITGWIVALLGFKLQVGAVALPALFGASLLALLGQGAWARTGRVAAGLCLLFIGLDMMQTGAAGFEDRLTPQTLPQGGIWGDLQLILLGLAVTVVMQSSSAAMAIALVLLGGGGISFEQAAAMVIGMNLGTTITAILASFGGSVTMRQTALANLLFNVGTALLAYPLLVLAGPLLSQAADRAGETTALVLFHTGFNLIGAAMFLPFTAAFARMVERLVPDRSATAVAGGLTAALDPALLKDEGAAMDAAQTALGRVARHVFSALGRALAPTPDMRGLATIEEVARPAMIEIADYITRINLPEGKPAERERYAALLHQADHLSRLLKRLERRSVVPVLLADPGLSRMSNVLGATLRRAADPAAGGLEATRLARLSQRIEAKTKRHRRATLLHEHVGLISVAEMFDRTDAMRWLRRVSEHAARIAFYARPLPGDTAQAPADPGPAA